MITHLKWWRDPLTHETRFAGAIDDYELAMLLPKLDGLDRAVLREPVESAADFLLSAEIVFRRAAEDAAKEKPNA